LKAGDVIMVRQNWGWFGKAELKMEAEELTVRLVNGWLRFAVVSLNWQRKEKWSGGGFVEMDL
jgi:hypothetical protein